MAASLLSAALGAYKAEVAEYEAALAYEREHSVFQGGSTSSGVVEDDGTREHTGTEPSWVYNTHDPPVVAVLSLPGQFTGRTHLKRRGPVGPLQCPCPPLSSPSWSFCTHRFSIIVLPLYLKKFHGGVYILVVSSSKQISSDILLAASPLSLLLVFVRYVCSRQVLHRL